MNLRKRLSSGDMNLRKGRGSVLKKTIIGFMLFLACQLCFVPATASAIPMSPYYKYFVPEDKTVNQHERVLETISFSNARVMLFTNEKAHCLGVRVAMVANGQAQETGHMIVRTVKSRPITARRSITDDGSIFQYWEYKPFHVLFGYTTDRRVKRVQLKFTNTVKPLNLYEGKYFVCILDPRADQLIEAQGLASDGRTVRTWNGHFDYPARRSWLSFFVQTYPYVVDVK